MMKSGAAESAPLLQRQETHETPKPGAIAAAVRQAKRGVGVFGVALALSGVLVAVLNAPETTKKRATASSRENQNLYARAAAAAFSACSGSVRAEQGRDIPQARDHAHATELGLLADLLAIDGLALPRDLLPHADQVLLRRPLLSSRCSRWHRVPRPRRVDGATCHAIDAMPHAG